MFQTVSTRVGVAPGARGMLVSHWVHLIFYNVLYYTFQIYALERIASLSFHAWKFGTRLELGWNPLGMLQI